MPDPTLKEVAELAKPLAELLKVLKEVSATPPEAKPVERETRSGPLQVLGRLYLGLTAIVAAAASLSAFVDWRVLHSVSTATTVLRLCLGIVVLVGVAGSCLLVWSLAERHPALLSSPSEFDSTVHGQLMDETASTAELNRKPRPPKGAPAGTGGAA